MTRFACCKETEIRMRMREVHFCARGSNRTNPHENEQQLYSREKQIF